MAAAKKTASKAAKKTTPRRSAAKKAAPKTSAAAKARRDREVYKVSPLRGMPVEKWIAAKTGGWQSEVVRRVLDVFKRAAPEATCSIKWAQPVWELEGPFAFVKPAKAHVSVGFWRGSEVADPKGLLSRGDRMGHFKLLGPDELDEAALAAMVKDAVRLNKSKGSPTKR
jgi:hypothetical protein